MRIATSGNTSTDSIPAPISDAPTCAVIAPRSVPIPTIATIRGNPVAPNSASPTSRERELPQPEQRRCAPNDDEQGEEERRQADARALSRLSMSNVMPVTTK